MTTTISRRRRTRKDAGGRPITQTICPTCGNLDSYGHNYRHVSQCKNNDPRLISVEDWRRDMNTRKYVCPLGCGKRYSYRKMLNHIAECLMPGYKLRTFKGEAETARNRWINQLIATNTQPGAEMAAAAAQAPREEQDLLPA